HVPVLADAVRGWAAGSRRAVDATAGGGGHAALLKAAGAELLAIDRDPAAIAAARARLGEDGVRYLNGAFAAGTTLAAGAALRPGALRASVSGPADRGQRRARAAHDRATRLPGRADAGRAVGRDHVSFGRGSHRQAPVSRMEPRVHLPAAPAHLHLPRPRVGTHADQ